MAREDLPKAVIQTHLVHQSSLFAHSLMLKRFRLSTCNLCRKILGLEVDPAPRRAACATGDVGAIWEQPQFCTSDHSILNKSYGDVTLNRAMPWQNCHLFIEKH